MAQINTVLSESSTMRCVALIACEARTSVNRDLCRGKRDLVCWQMRPVVSLAYLGHGHAEEVEGRDGQTVANHSRY